MTAEAKMLDPTYIDPELDQILKTSPAVPGMDANTDIPALRKRLADAKKALTAAAGSVDDGSVLEEDRQVPMRDGASITVRIYRSARGAAQQQQQQQDGSGAPVLVMYHGGGFCLGGLENETVLCRRWADEFGGVAVNVDYRLAPEHVFPAAVHDAYDALRWVAANITSLGGDATRALIIGGISAGANIAAVISHLYRDDRVSPALTGVYLSIPSVFSPEAVPERFKHQYHSLEQNADAPILGKGSMELFARHYQEDGFSPLRSPILFATGQRGLPPTYFQICGMDPLRDEGLIYEQMLREEAGVRTRVDLYPGLPHGFWSFFPTAAFTRRQQEDSAAGLAWLLRESESEQQ